MDRTYFKKQKGTPRRASQNFDFSFLLIRMYSRLINGLDSCHGSQAQTTTCQPRYVSRVCSQSQDCRIPETHNTLQRKSFESEVSSGSAAAPTLLLGNLELNFRNSITQLPGDGTSIKHGRVAEST